MVYRIIWKKKMYINFPISKLAKKVSKREKSGQRKGARDGASKGQSGKISYKGCMFNFHNKLGKDVIEREKVNKEGRWCKQRIIWHKDAAWFRPS